MKKILFTSVAIFTIIFLIHSEFSKTEAALSDNLLRLHVVANSDSEDDQKLKLMVRDAIIEECSFLFEENSDISKAKCVVENNLEKIEKCAIEEIRRNGYDYDVRIYLGKSDFPTKQYGELTLPKGQYEALRVEIGSGTGQNWWCVLFPPLCFVNNTCVSVSEESVEAFSKSIGEGNKEFVSTKKRADVELKFKAYEVWQSGKKKLAMLF